VIQFGEQGCCIFKDIILDCDVFNLLSSQGKVNLYSCQ